MPPFAAIWMLAPPADAVPTSEIHSAADELFCTRNPFSGTMPPNSICARRRSRPCRCRRWPPPAVLTTGSGFAARPAPPRPAHWSRPAHAPAPDCRCRRLRSPAPARRYWRLSPAMSWSLTLLRGEPPISLENAVAGRGSTSSSVSAQTSASTRSGDTPAVAAIEIAGEARTSGLRAAGTRRHGAPAPARRAPRPARRARPCRAPPAPRGTARRGRSCAASPRPSRRHC